MEASSWRNKSPWLDAISHSCFARVPLIFRTIFGYTSISSRAALLCWRMRAGSLGILFRSCFFFLLSYRLPNSHKKQEINREYRLKKGKCCMILPRAWRSVLLTFHSPVLTPPTYYGAAFFVCLFIVAIDLRLVSKFEKTTLSAWNQR